MTDHIIGVLHANHLITVRSLKAHINLQLQLAGQAEKRIALGLPRNTITVYSLADYCNTERPTDLTRFNYCPRCGERIDWERILDGTFDNNCT